MIIEYVRADPGGNITLLVTSAVDPNLRAELSRKILNSGKTDAEQIGFVARPVNPQALGRLEMMGGEFCGNAARAFACYLAIINKLNLPVKLSLEMSGYNGLLQTWVENELVWARMPGPISVCQWDNGTIVRMPGITHYIIDGKPDKNLVDTLIERYGKSGPEALGVLFVQGDDMTPAVYVEKTGSLFWESSCGSGTAACAATRCARLGRDCEVRLKQPGGILGARAWLDSGGIFAELFGPVTIGGSEIMDV